MTDSCPCPVPPATTWIRTTYLVRLCYQRFFTLSVALPVGCLPVPWGASASTLAHTSGRGHVQTCKSGHRPRSLGHPLHSSSRLCPPRVRFVRPASALPKHRPALDLAPMGARASHQRNQLSAPAFRHGDASRVAGLDARATTVPRAARLSAV